MKRIYISLFTACVCLFALNRAAAQIKPITMRQIQSLLDEKAARTPVQRKMQSSLLQAVKEHRGEKMANDVSLLPAQVEADVSGNLAVDIDGNVTDALLTKIKELGGVIIYPSKEYRTIRAKIKLDDVEKIAAFPEVTFIQPAQLSYTNGFGDVHSITKKVVVEPIVSRGLNNLKPSIAQKKQQVKKQLEKYMIMLGTGTVNSEGDHAHKTDSARNAFGYAGQGIKIGVLSNSYDANGYAAANVANGNLPGVGNPLGNTTPVTVLQDVTGTSDEGQAMIQIVHDLVPKAQLFFATANSSQANFAANIKALRAAGCDVIIDDVFYYAEGTFQDGTVAQAVNAVTADGAMYFSSAGNAGSLLKGTSGVFEGDFNNVGSPTFTGSGKAGGSIHNFGTGTVGDVITKAASGFYNLTWADPLGKSNNDYDLFLVDINGTVKASSTTTQSGSSDPYEQIATATLVAGDQLVVFKSASAAVRAFALNANRGALTVATFGQTHGHGSAVNAYAVAAAPAAGAFSSVSPTGPYPGVFTTASQLEVFSSDGPRRMFFNADTTPISGNYTFASGGYTTRNKPDITAADGVVTSVPGFIPFYGTSAAAPHAGAIAALLKSANPSLTAAQIRTILTTTALDIEGPGYENNSGFGIIDVYKAVQAITPAPLAVVSLGTVKFTEGSFSNGNGNIDQGETGNLSVQLKNLSKVAATNVTATITSNTAGVTITNGIASYGNIASLDSAINASPFTFGVNSSVACGTALNFYMIVTFGGGASPQSFTLTITAGPKAVGTITSSLGATPPAGTGYTAVTGTMDGQRLNRITPISSCGVQKAAPIVTSTSGTRTYDAYTIPNSNPTNQCVTVTMTAPNGINLYMAAYNSLGFDPTVLNKNFLADQGTSASTQSFSFTDTAGKPFTLVVYNINPGSDVGSAYSIDISLNNCSVSPSCNTITITPTTIANGVSGTAYNQAFTATGGSNSGSFAYSLSGILPAGLNFTGNTITGTPTHAGKFPIAVTATDPVGCTATKAYDLIIAGDTATSIVTTAGTPQTGAPGSYFATAFKAKVSNKLNQPLSGVKVMFTSPLTGVSGTFANGNDTLFVVTDAAGIATAPNFTANTITGIYNVVATVIGVSIPTANFSLTNGCTTNYVVTSNADSGPGTLRDIVNNSCTGITVTFDPSVTNITLTSGELAINKAMTITGPGANLLTISGNNASRIFNLTAGVSTTVNISGLTIINGKVPSGQSLGGGGIIINTGILNLSGALMSNCDALLAATSDGGGIYNRSTNSGAITIDKSTFTNNISDRLGGAIAQWGTGTMTLTNSTVVGNRSIGASSGSGNGGGFFYNTVAVISNCTFYGNVGFSNGGNIRRNGSTGTLTMGNTIVGGGSLTSASATNANGPDVYGAYTSTGYNLIQNAGSVTVTGLVTGNQQGVDPKLLPLANYGGPTPTMLPMSNSPVIDAGNPALSAALTDQRNTIRLAGSSADIGSVEAKYTYVATSGFTQSTPINFSFPLPLVIQVRELGNLIAGDSVTFTAPISGASGLFANGSPRVVVATNVSGLATSPTFTANGFIGTYNVVGSIGLPGNTGTNFVLTNISSAPIAFSGCPNNNLIVARPGYNTYNNEPVSFYMLDTATGAATLMAGGPLKDSATGKNIDVNGAGLNVKDGFLYAIRDTVNAGGTAITPMFYKIGSNYIGRKMFNIPVIPNMYINPASGTFDDNDNFYFIAVTGSATNSTTFQPNNYYLGKLSNVSTLTTNSNTLSYTLMNFSGANCSSFNSNITAAVTTTGANTGTGIQDITYSNIYKSLFFYESFQSPANSGNYIGQLFSLNPSTGVVTCNPSTSSTFGAINNEVSGISTVASGNFRIFTTNGDIYRTNLTSSGFTSTLIKVGASGISTAGAVGGIRGDLASCNVGAVSLPAAALPPSITVGLPNQIVVYPNPSQGITTISVGQPLTNATARLLGSTGNVIAEKTGISGFTFQFDLTGKAGGIYTVQVIQGSTIQVVKLMKP